MKKSNTSNFNPRLLAIFWLLICSILVVSLVTLLPQSRLSTSILALLPAQSAGDMPPELKDEFMQRLDRQLVWMVSSGTKENIAPAQYWLEQLGKTPFLTQVKGPMTAAQQQAWGAFYYQHRNAMLDPATRDRLKSEGTQQANWILSQVYSAFSGVSGQELSNDPLMLVRGSQLALQQTSSQLRLQNGWLVAKDNAGREWYLLHAELNGSSFDMQQGHQAVTELNRLEQSLKARFPDTEVMSRGTLFYSDYASQQAKHDISTLGSATILGVLLLIYGVFRSLKPLLLCVLSVSIGALAGTVVTLGIFGELHFMTLVMSISIIGISADYAIYYLTERMVHGQEVTAWQSMRKVLTALLMALATTVIAYLIMMFAPFPGLRQLAVFAAAGLTASCLTVICWYPILAKNLPVRPIPAMVMLMRWLALWRRSRVFYPGLPVALAVFALLGISRLEINDDIAQLQVLPQHIHQQEKRIAELTGQRSDQKWFVVYGDSAEQTLQRLEAFIPKLDAEKQQGMITSYQQLPLSSLAQQHKDLELLKAAVPNIITRLAEAGLPVKQPDLRPMTVTPNNWLNSVVSEGWRLMWITLPNGQSGVLLPVTGVKDSMLMRQLAEKQAGISWVDRKLAFDEMFQFYRTILGWLLAGSVVLIAVSYIIRLGLRRGTISILPSLLSLGCALAVLGFSGYSLNLFSILALVLVLGIGINYTLFFSNPRGTPLTSLLAITVAMCTSLLTLGMLVFSSTQAISSFGIVLCSGIFTAFLLSPLAMPERPKRNKKA
ncbi:MMPL family transporter [Xenorhabdus cabanillasii]|uniref:Membrane protein n=1 Tax=Xenorhabdus cabanillasii JM26 TaxID=1427517 RepID=W1JAL3_9GAMM|nr:MMPL family transporter [Xenorhabdus cabanillasii]PHM75984.1 membrane protein [Xenorhabdus cabanillasii JM26]CDL86540.1 putative membrane protein [Xenorhabdus cabanillasii JM26]